MNIYRIADYVFRIAGQRDLENIDKAKELFTKIHKWFVKNKIILEGILNIIHKGYILSKLEG